MYDIINKIYEFKYSETFLNLYNRYICLNVDKFDRVYTINCNSDYTKRTGIINIHFINFENENRFMFINTYINLDYCMAPVDIKKDNFLIILDVNSSFFGKRNKLIRSKVNFSCNLSYLFISNLVQVNHKTIYFNTYSFSYAVKELLITINELKNTNIYGDINMDIYDFASLINYLKYLYGLGTLNQHGLYLDNVKLNIYNNNSTYLNNTIFTSDLAIDFTNTLNSKYTYDSIKEILNYNKVAVNTFLVYIGSIYEDNIKITDFINKFCGIFCSEGLYCDVIHLEQFVIKDCNEIIEYQSYLYPYIGDKIHEIEYCCDVSQSQYIIFKKFITEHKKDILFKNIVLTNTETMSYFNLF